MNQADIKTIYASLKRRHGSKTLLLFRVGNQLEAYLDDATIVASVLGLQPEQAQLGQPYPLLAVGFPVSEQEAYTNRLLDAGHAVFVQQARDAEGNYQIESNE